MNTSRHDAAGRRGVVTVAVTSGKGGVGKTNVVVNLAVALARLHNRVAILDADFGLGNVDVLLGLTPAHHLGHCSPAQKAIEDIVVEGPLGIRMVPASSGLRELTALTPAQWQRLREGSTRSPRRSTSCSSTRAPASRATSSTCWPGRSASWS
jgi:MinD-like ATPase involved in chromosome partitioning or flagellar assembly